ncbi:DUF2292 domain-containing protein [Desulforamulus aquiferis]|uniref:DUF2292 domain-containing protein n=1 Tax=Desulforamulus aquiferis TaxID=1397668 RepID=UPI003570A42F
MCFLFRTSEQLISEIKKKSHIIDQLRYGEVVIKIQDGKAVWGEIKTVWKADSNKREARA